MKHLAGVAALLLTAGLGLASCAGGAKEAALQAPAVALEPAQPAPPPAPAVPRYSAKAFFETTSFGVGGGGSAPAFSPDGRSLLIHHDATGVFNAYWLALDGSGATPLTASTDNATFAETAFPADGRVLVSADKGGDELDHVYVRAEDGTLKDLTPGEKTKAGLLGWRQDGQAFYLMTNERDARWMDVYEYSAKDYARKRLFQNDKFGVGALSRDGRWLALSEERTSADNNLYLLDLQKRAAKPALITQHQGNISHAIYEFTPDNRQLVFGTDAHGEFVQAWTHDLASGAQAPLITADWDVMFVTHSPSGRYRVHAVNEDASTRLTLLDRQTGAPVALSGLPAGDVTNVRFAPGERQIALTVVSDTSPADIFVADLATGQAERLTRALNPEIEESALVEARIARYRSFDGLEIPGVLYQPKGASAANPAPAIVLVHGGPGGQTRRGYSALVQHLVNHGYAVFGANNRGSSGYGKTFFHLDDKRHGEVDLKDIVQARKYLESLDWVDKERIAVMGGSYGGYMTAAALAFAPDAFDVGVNIFGVTNWVRTLTSIPPWWAAFREALFDEMGDPAVDAERHRAISPLFHAANIKKPMLVVQGANDPRVLQVESDELVAAVKANGVPVEYVLFPDEGHGFLKKENRITASEAYLAFLDTHLKGEPAK